MNAKDAERYMAEIAASSKGQATTHVATSTFREGVIQSLSRDPELQGGHSIELVEIFLTEELPEIDNFAGIFAVDELGIWYYDGDGHIDDPVWRQRLIPWRFVKGLVLHQAS